MRHARWEDEGSRGGGQGQAPLAQQGSAGDQSAPSRGAGGNICRQSGSSRLERGATGGCWTEVSEAAGLQC